MDEPYVDQIQILLDEAVASGLIEIKGYDDDGQAIYIATVKGREHVEAVIAARSQPSITCPRCRMVSYNPGDIEHGYCGLCADFTRMIVL